MKKEGSNPLFITRFRERWRFINGALQERKSPLLRFPPYFRWFSLIFSDSRAVCDAKKRGRAPAKSLGMKKPPGVNQVTGEKVPKSIVFGRGKLPGHLKQLEHDLRKLMLPHTALKLKVSFKFFFFNSYPFWCYVVSNWICNYFSSFFVEFLFLWLFFSFYEWFFFLLNGIVDQSSFRNFSLHDSDLARFLTCLLYAHCVLTKI